VSNPGAFLPRISCACVLGRARAGFEVTWRHEGVRAALLFAGAVLVYLWPTLVGGRELSTATTLYDVAPWQASATPDIIHYHNGVINDPTQT
jgi:hypothetical protein